VWKHGTPIAAGVPRVVLTDRGCASDLVLVLGSLKADLINDTNALAAFDLWRVHDGRSYDEFVVAAAGNERSSVTSPVEVGPHAVAALLKRVEVVAASRGRLEEQLIPGTYTVACLRAIGTPVEAIIVSGSFVIR
jgi:hypothetical protein